MARIIIALTPNDIGKILSHKDAWNWTNPNGDEARTSCYSIGRAR